MFHGHDYDNDDVSFKPGQYSMLDFLQVFLLVFFFKLLPFLNFILVLLN